MKSMQLPLVVMFFMTYFHRAGGGDPLLKCLKYHKEISNKYDQKTDVGNDKCVAR